MNDYGPEVQELAALIMGNPTFVAILEAGAKSGETSESYAFALGFLREQAALAAEHEALS